MIDDALPLQTRLDPIPLERVTPDLIRDIQTHFAQQGLLHGLNRATAEVRAQEVIEITTENVLLLLTDNWHEILPGVPKNEVTIAWIKEFIQQSLEHRTEQVQQELLEKLGVREGKIQKYFSRFKRFGATKQGSLVSLMSGWGVISLLSYFLIPIITKTAENPGAKFAWRFVVLFVWSMIVMTCAPEFLAWIRKKDTKN